jgi:hypothetical protein
VDSVEVNGGSEENFFQLFLDGVLYVHTKTVQRQIRINLEKGQHTVTFVWRQAASRTNKRDANQSFSPGVLTFLTNKLYILHIKLTVSYVFFSLSLFVLLSFSSLIPFLI